MVCRENDTEQVHKVSDRPEHPSAAAEGAAQGIQLRREGYVDKSGVVGDYGSGNSEHRQQNAYKKKTWMILCVMKRFCLFERKDKLYTNEEKRQKNTKPPVIEAFVGAKSLRQRGQKK